MSAQTVVFRTAKPAASVFQAAFVVAWLFCLLFYFMEYAVRSAPSVMLPELTKAFGLTTVGLSSLLGLYFYSYAAFAILAGAAVDRWGAKYTVSIGVLLLALGTAMFGVEISWVAAVGRFLQGAGAAFAFIAAVYLAAHGLPARYIASAIGVTQCIGMLGGAAGQFVAAPLIHGPLVWQQFWFYSGGITLLIAVAMFMATPREPRAADAQASIWSTFAPYKTVLANPQSWLCGLCAGLLFLPTTVGAMTWGVAFMHDGWQLGYAQAVDRAAMVPIGWVFGCPVLGYLADFIGRRKPLLIAGAALMLAAMLAILYLPPETFPPYVLAFLLGFGSGAAMIPYSIIKEVNPDNAKGSATGAINFLVFVMSALVAPAVGWWLQRLADGGPFTLNIFVKADSIFAAAIALAVVVACFLKETGSEAQKAP
ncbi:MAG TPA: MFS transporter [Paraburkholderia sp.]|uniref:MFS transporter n=1 Tax=Paraburkholderia sp. TaxID=1926495 RepID=UPI002CC7F9CC|nr:MFS transporter [Paraburkholderia sp.]HTR07036.1 MFS transporter [Paraburkholderia sp.]